MGGGGGYYRFSRSIVISVFERVAARAGYAAFCFGGGVGVEPDGFSSCLSEPAAGISGIDSAGMVSAFSETTSGGVASGCEPSILVLLHIGIQTSCTQAAQKKKSVLPTSGNMGVFILIGVSVNFMSRGSVSRVLVELQLQN